MDEEDTRGGLLPAAALVQDRALRNEGPMTGNAIAALVPAALLIALGWGLRRRALLPYDFWRPAEWLSYYILLPALFIHGLATAQLSGVPVGRLMVVLIGSVTVVAAATVAARRAFPVDDPGFTSVFQGAIRFNNYVGVLVATGLYGAEGTALAAVANAAIVPTVNILSVMVFSRFGSARPTLGGIVRQVATNPLVVACVVGGTLQVSGLGLHPAIGGAFKALGQAALALGLLCVGAALDLGAARGDLGPALRASVVKFAVLPAVTLAGCAALGLGGAAAMVAVLFHTLPTASSSYILARQMGGDARLMASIIALQTILAGAAIPLVAALAAPLLT